MDKIKITSVSAEGCASCRQAEETLKEIKEEYPRVKIEKVKMTSGGGQEIVMEHQIMSSPGIIINGKLFSSGNLDKEKLIEYIKNHRQKG